MIASIMIFWFRRMFPILLVLALPAAWQAIRPTQPRGPIAPIQTTATIHGTTMDAKTGSPLRDVQVTMNLMGGGAVARSARSDATGRYEFQVAPGLYSVFVSKDGFAEAQYLDIANVPGLQLLSGAETVVDFIMTPGATISGNVADVRGAPIPDAIVQAMMKIYREGKVEMQLRASARTNPRGQYTLSNLPAGHYYLRAGATRAADAGIGMLTPMFYPGVSLVDDAQALSLVAGEGTADVNFQLPDANTHSVSGSVTFLDTGQPVTNMDISVFPDFPRFGTFPGFGTRVSTQSGNDGTFRLRDLTAGPYRVEGKLTGEGHGRAGGHIYKFLEVRSADITDMSIQISTGTTLKGNLRPVGGTLPERMSVLAFVRNPIGGAGHAFEAAVAPDGTFQIDGLYPGIGDLVIRNPVGAAHEFFVATITVDGKEVSDTGITVPEHDSVDNVSVMIDRQPGAITGKILNFDDSPIPGANVVLMSADPEKRLRSRYWRQIKSDREGSFVLSSLIPGEYRLITWLGYRPWACLDPQVFAILEKYATHVTVERGTVVTRNLRLTQEILSELSKVSP